jgi:hypothetical protein
VQQVLSARLDRGAQHFRIGGDKVRRRHRVHVLARVEGEFVARRRIKIAGARHAAQQPLRGQQITLTNEIEQRQLPVGAAKAPVDRRGAAVRRRLAAHRRKGALPQLRVALPELRLRLQQPRRIPQQGLVERGHRLAEATHHPGHDRRVGHRAGKALTDQLLDLRRDRRQLIQHRGRIKCRGVRLGHQCDLLVGDPVDIVQRTKTASSVVEAARSCKAAARPGAALLGPA